MNAPARATIHRTISGGISCRFFGLVRGGAAGLTRRVYFPSRNRFSPNARRASIRPAESTPFRRHLSNSSTARSAASSSGVLRSPAAAISRHRCTSARRSRSRFRSRSTRRRHGTHRQPRTYRSRPPHFPHGDPMAVAPGSGPPPANEARSLMSPAGFSIRPVTRVPVSYLFSQFLGVSGGFRSVKKPAPALSLCVSVNHPSPAHNPKVEGSNPSPATKGLIGRGRPRPFCCSSA